MKEVILTGGLGFIGSHTAVALIEAGYSPVIIDDLRNSYSFILDNIEEITGKRPLHYTHDCCDKLAMTKIFEQHKNAEGVIHFAAYKSVNDSVNEPNSYYHNNLQSLVIILDLMDQFDMDHLVFSSSCTVYGIPDQIPVTEQTPTKEAESPYGFTKQVGERICRDWSTAKNKKVILLRYFNPIGAHETGAIGELPMNKPTNLVPYITQSAMGKIGPLTVHGNDYDTPDGSCIRDYIHVVDLAEAHVKGLDVLNKQSEVKTEVVNLATGRGASVLELVNAFQEVNGVKLNYNIGPRREGDVPAIYAKCDYANSYLGWTARFTMEDALKHAWQWEMNLKNTYQSKID